MNVSVRKYSSTITYFKRFEDIKIYNLQGKKKHGKREENS